MRWPGIAALSALAACVAMAPSQRVDIFYQGGAQKLLLKAYAAAAENRMDAAYEVLREALAAAPEDPLLLWEAAGTAGRIGRVDDSIGHLERLGRLRTGWNLASIAPKALLENPRFVAAARSGTLPNVHHTVEALAVVREDLVTEGMAYDTRTRTLFLGDVQRQKILAVDPDGTPRDLVGAGQDGLLRVLGMKVEQARNLLWAVSYAPAWGPAAGRGCLHAFDLSSGRTVERYEVPSSGAPHLFNDLEIVNGDVYVTDTNGGGLYRLESRTRSFSELLPAGTFLQPNGIAGDPAGTKLFVATWPTVAVVDLATRSIVGLRYAGGACPAGIDGLYYYRGSLIGIQNGVGCDRVARFFLDSAQHEILRMEVLESGNPAFEIPTTGAVAGDAFYLIANSQLGRRETREQQGDGGHRCAGRPTRGSAVRTRCCPGARGTDFEISVHGANLAPART